MKPNIRHLYLIITVIIFSFFVAFPRVPIKFDLGNFSVDSFIGGDEIDVRIPGFGRIYKNFEYKKGLDIQGGVHVVLKANMAEISLEDRENALESAKDVIDRRVNLFGVSEPSIYTSKVGSGENIEYRIVVDLPGVTDTTEAINLIGDTAQLEFRTLVKDEFSQDAEESSDNNVLTEETTETSNIEVPGLGVFAKTDLTGKDLRRAEVVFSSGNSQTQAALGSTPQVSLTFNKEGAQKFAKLTEENIGSPIAIFLDGQIVSAPMVQQAILDGNAVITGGFTVEQAQSLAIQLRAGALPVSVEVIEQQEIGPTLGQDSVKKSFIAGVIGFLVVNIFMLIYYKKLGFIANIALFIYVAIVIAIYKGMLPGLGSIVLTLPGLAGFLLSIGMAVDANILIFERIREEVEDKKPLGIAIEQGFARSWNSVRDSNISTLITAFILINPFGWGLLVTSGPVRGFAITLAIGIIVSLFTGVIVTRNLIRFFYKG